METFSLGSTCKGRRCSGSGLISPSSMMELRIDNFRVENTHLLSLYLICRQEAASRKSFRFTSCSLWSFPHIVMPWTFWDSWKVWLCCDGLFMLFILFIFLRFVKRGENLGVTLYPSKVLGRAHHHCHVTSQKGHISAPRIGIKIFYLKERGLSSASLNLVSRSFTSYEVIEDTRCSRPPNVTWQLSHIVPF